jgi:hypothetical protein
LDHTTAVRDDNTIAAAVAGGKLDLAIENCGKSNPAQLTGIEPNEVTLGESSTVTARGTSTKGVTGGTYDLTMKQAGFPYLTLLDAKNQPLCPGAPTIFKVGPAIGPTVGTITYGGIKQCADGGVAAGDIEMDIAIEMSAMIPAKLASATSTLIAKGANGESLLCSKLIVTKK